MRIYDVTEKCPLWIGVPPLRLHYSTEVKCVMYSRPYKSTRYYNYHIGISRDITCMSLYALYMKDFIE